jgi:flagellar protein FlaG
METLSINRDTAVAMPMQSPAQISPAPTVSKDTNPVMVATKQKSESVDMETLTNKLNKVSQDEHLDISFGYNKKIDRVFINVVDKNTGDVIRKLPSEEAMKFAEGVKEMLGKILDKKG